MIANEHPKVLFYASSSFNCLRENLKLCQFYNKIAMFSSETQKKEFVSRRRSESFSQVHCVFVMLVKEIWNWKTVSAIDKIVLQIFIITAGFFFAKKKITSLKVLEADCNENHRAQIAADHWSLYPITRDHLPQVLSTCTTQKHKIPESDFGHFAGWQFFWTPLGTIFKTLQLSGKHATYAQDPENWRQISISGSSEKKW